VTDVRRREFITLLGGTAAAWPLVAHAQQSVMPVIGFMSSRSPEDSVHLLEAFRRGLKEGGFSEGQNVAIEFRWAHGDYSKLPALAADLVSRRVNVLTAVGGDPSPHAAKRATSTIPIVFGMGGDPVSDGLVESFNRPGGNVTGVTLLTNLMEPKRLGLLRELAPGVTLIGALVNPAFAPASGRFVCRKRDRLRRLPTIYQFREYAVVGGLLSYGVSITNAYRQFGVYTAAILKGAKPADLPVQQPSKFELVINLKTAKALGLKISDDLLSLADEVIE